MGQDSPGVELTQEFGERKILPKEDSGSLITRVSSSRTQRIDRIRIDRYIFINYRELNRISLTASIRKKILCII